MSTLWLLLVFQTSSKRTYQESTLVCVHFLQGPVKVLEVLDPFQIACTHAARVCQNVRNQVLTIVEEYIVCLRGGGPIGSLRDQFRADASRIPFRYHALQCCWTRMSTSISKRPRSLSSSEPGNPITEPVFFLWAMTSRNGIPVFLSIPPLESETASI